MRKRIALSLAFTPWIAGYLLIGLDGHAVAEPEPVVASAGITTTTTLPPTTSTTMPPPTTTTTTMQRASRGGHRTLLVTAPMDVVLACLRGPWKGQPQESNGRYDAISRSGKYRGAYQFEIGTWNGVVTRLGLVDLVDVDPATVAPELQDQAAAQLVRERGVQPWPMRDECAAATL